MTPPSPLTSKRKPKKLTQIRVNWQMENFTRFKRWRCSTCGSLKKFWYFQSWSSNRQTSCLWISKKVFKTDKTLLKYSLARNKNQFKLQKFSELPLGVPPWSTLGTLLLNIYINDLFYLTKLTWCLQLCWHTLLFMRVIQIERISLEDWSMTQC